MGLAEIGITENLNQKVSFTNIFTLKQRYEDFIVKEIQLDYICDKTSVYSIDEILKSIAFIIQLCDENEIESELIKNTKKYTKDNEKIFNKFYENNNCECKYINSLLFENNEFNLYNMKYNENICIGGFTCSDKIQREIIHKTVRNHPLVSSKTNEDKKIVLSFGHMSNRIYSFTLMKINKDTTEACSIISRAVKINHNEIKFAGNKDKRAITFQKVTIKGTNFYNLVTLANTYIESNNMIQLYNIRQIAQHTKLGDLIGNKFEINIKCLNSENIHLLKKLDFACLENGFINYYGQQRFGKNFNNHIIGEFLLNKDYCKAIEIIMKISPHESIVTTEAKELYCKGEYDLCLKKLPLRYKTEWTICNGKLKGYSDKKIVSNLKYEVVKLYLHAFQSYKFNLKVSELINQEDDIHNLYVDLEKEKSKHLKGGSRKVIERASNLLVNHHDDYINVCFDLSTSCYATIALREVIGDDVLFCYN